ncbi:LacI family DNA-binding transcriptional regulator [Amnibacterium endophyticum]|uniref:LacI family DNA-binding transcriptional regulator n=1 Tax=Amnibacterium endophyticum TaxID=2109337 RepID=A0ABW4LD78_9MICO
MRPTVKDVAERAGVSPKTVSNVLNGVIRVAPPTKERVERAIEDLGYVPNLSARGLRSGRTGIVALVVPELRTPFSAELTHEFVELAHARGLVVQIEQSWGDPSRTSELVTAARRHLVDGVVINPVTLQEHVLLIDQDGPGVPLVAIGEVPQHDVDQVWVDSVHAAREITRLLVGTGHRRIAMIGAPGGGLETFTGRMRRDGYREALLEAGLPLDPALERHCPDWSPRGGAEAVRRLLDEGVAVDALFCCTDSIAIGVLSALWSAGVRVPEDVSVAGFDDVADAQFASPPLTSVHFDRRDYAAAALERLVARIDGDDGPARQVVVPSTVVRRASVRERPAR